MKSIRKIAACVLALSLSVSMLSIPTSATGWVSSNGQYYYQKANGSYATGWLQVGNYRYYLNSKGQAVKGFQKINGKTYYFGNDYALYHGAVQQGKNVYFFDVNGVWYKTLTIEQLKAQLVRAPQGALKQAYSEPVRYNSKGVNQGYSDSMNWYACLDANFWKLFGNGSTKASTVANMPEEYKYQIYCASNIMNMLCVPNSTYQSYKKEAIAYIKSLREHAVSFKPDDSYVYLLPSGVYKDVKLQDLHLYKPFAYMNSSQRLLWNAYKNYDIVLKPRVVVSFEVADGSRVTLQETTNYYKNSEGKSVEYYDLFFTSKGSKQLNQNMRLGITNASSGLFEKNTSVDTHAELRANLNMSWDSIYTNSIKLNDVEKQFTSLNEAYKMCYAAAKERYRKNIDDYVAHDMVRVVDNCADIITLQVAVYENGNAKFSSKYKKAWLDLWYLPTTGECFIHVEVRDADSNAYHRLFTSLADAEDFIFN